MTDLCDLSKAKGLKLCHLNIRSILNKIDQFRMHFEHSKLDVIALSETWLSSDLCSNILQLENYQLFRWDRAFNRDNSSAIKRGGGLLLYIHKDINFNLMVDVGKNISSPDCELQRIELCSDVQKNIVLYNIYRPPSGKVHKFVEHLSSVYEKEERLTTKETVFLGDFNINYSAKKSCDTKKLISWQHKFGLTQHIKSPTRASKSARSVIDLIFSSIDHCTNSGVLDLHISDHQPVYIVKKKLKDNRSKICFKGRTYVNYSKELLSD